MSGHVNGGDVFAKTGEDYLPTSNLVGGLIKLTMSDLAAVLLLLVIGLAPLGFAWHFLVGQIFNTEQFALVLLLGLFALCIIETFAILLLAGLQRLALPDSTLKWLGAATIGEVAGLLIVVLKWVHK